MSKSKKLIAASALLAPFALAAISLYPQKSPAISPSQLYTWDCELPVHKPDAITLTCGDGGMYLDHIDWSRWDARKAQGSAIFNINECDPSCAEGKFLHTPVNISLTKIQEYKGKHFLRTLVIRTNDGKNLPMFGSDTYQWDVMEFEEMINSTQDGSENK